MFLIANFVYRDMGPLQQVSWREDGEAIGSATLRNMFVITKNLPVIFFHQDTKKVMVEGAKTTIMLMFIFSILCVLDLCIWSYTCIHL